jgi:hypothetical protein
VPALVQLRCGARVYSVSMQRTTVAVLLIACATLIGTQLTGAHAHVDSHGFDGAVQSTHEHHHHDEGDHDGATDLQVADLGISAAKAVFLLFAVCLSPFLLPPARGQAPLPYESRLPAGRRLRWRPPLRAPPRSITTS